MFSISFPNTETRRTTFSKFVTLMLMAAVFIFSTPAPFVLAQDAGTGGDSSGTSGDAGGDSGDTGGDAGGDSGGAGGDTTGGETSGDGAGGAEDGASGDAAASPTTSQTTGNEEPLRTTAQTTAGDDDDDTTPPASTGDDDDASSSADDETPGTDGESGTDGADPTQTGSSTEETTDTNDGTSGTPADDVTVITDNQGGQASSTASSTNDGTQGGGDIVIDTGDANANGGIINQSNTNVTNTDGGTGGGSLLNEDEDTATTSDVIDDTTEATTTQTLNDAIDAEALENASSTPDTASTTVKIGNLTIATNTASILAETGQNTSSSTGSSSILTGDAISFGYVISLFNIVVTNSSGLFLFLQNPLGSALDLTSKFMGVFGAGDEVAEENTLCSFFGCETLDSALALLTQNVADIYNKLLVTAGTGGNHSTSTDALIDTGFARAFGSIFNMGNLQIVNSRYLVILLNNTGDLDGNIVLPPPDFFKNLSGSARTTSDMDIAATSTADVQNTGTTTSDTGDNEAHAEENSIIDTGEATTETLVYNDINSNIIGGSPICFIVSVGGDWNGNVIGLPDGFSRQETALGEIICGDGQGDNRHDLPDNFTADTINYAKVLNEAIIEATTGGNSGTGENVAIKTGDAEAVLQIINVLNKNIIAADWIFSLTTISGDFNGNLMFGSQEFWDKINKKISGGPVALRLRDAEIEITKTASVTEITASTTVDYTVVIKNTGDPAYRSTFVDVIYDPEGKPIHREEWTLDTIYPDEEITITYSVFFNASTTPGTYTNAAYLKGVQRNPNIEQHYGNEIDSPIASAEIEVIGAEDEKSAPLSCGAYLTKYLRFGDANDPAEVAKLQIFLRDHEGVGIDVTGEFDEDTLKAVHSYQARRGSDVLSPWGIVQSTGYVYYTTQKAINEAMCEGAKMFPLTAAQRAEINQFKVRWDEFRGEIPAEELEKIGSEEPTVKVAIEDSEDSRSDAERILAAVGTAGWSDEISARGGLWAWFKSSILDLFAWVTKPFGVLYAQAFER